MEALIREELSADGVLLATIDMPGRSMNVFSADLMDALEALMDRVDGNSVVRGVVLTSGKSTFLAGADLVMVRGFCDAGRTATDDQLMSLCGRLGRLFVRLEASSKPWVAAVNGLALGGGLELALACRKRLVADNPKLQLGVPEVRWGLLPGAGGTQRLPRMCGLEAALDMLLTGKPISPQEALARNIVDAVVPADQLLAHASAEVLALSGTPLDWQAKYAHLDQREVPEHSPDAAREAARRHGADDATFARYPAYSAIADSVLKGARLSLADATTIEMQQFLRLMRSPVAERMIRTLFLERLRAERELEAKDSLRLQSIVSGPLSAACEPWLQALSRSRVPCATDAQLPEDTLALTDSTGVNTTVRIAVLEQPLAAPGPVAVLGPTGPYGRVLEIVGGGPAVEACAALAARLGCLPWRTPGPSSALQRLQGLPIEQQAQVAEEIAAAPGAGDPEFLDVAACLAGVSPAWTGGPLMWKATRDR